jgi:hypothetical protein
VAPPPTIVIAGAMMVAMTMVPMITRRHIRSNFPNSIVPVTPWHDSLIVRGISIFVAHLNTNAYSTLHFIFSTMLRCGIIILSSTADLHPGTILYNYYKFTLRCPS